MRNLQFYVSGKRPIGDSSHLPPTNHDHQRADRYTGKVWKAIFQHFPISGIISRYREIDSRYREIINFPISENYFPFTPEGGCFAHIRGKTPLFCLYFIKRFISMISYILQRNYLYIKSSGGVWSWIKKFNPYWLIEISAWIVRVGVLPLVTLHSCMRMMLLHLLNLLGNCNMHLTLLIITMVS